MNINKLLLFGNKNKKYASSLKRSSAAVMDVWITLLIRAFFAQMIGMLWLNQKMLDFILEFKTEFGTDIPKNTPEHINFIIHHPFFYYMLIFYAFIVIIGAVYHSYLNSSAWKGTIGKRAMKIMLTRKNDLPITFNRGMLHYFLSLLPFVFLFYLLTYQIRYEATLYQALTSSDVNIFLGIVFVLWVQIHLFTKNKVTAYDMITNVVAVNGRASAKWPWSKPV